MRPLAYRKTHDRAAFERAISGAERPLPWWRGAHVEVTCELELAGGERLPLVREGDRWHIARDPLDSYPQRTPEEALRSFSRVVAGRRYDLALHFVPSRYRGQLTAESLRARWEGERRAQLLAELAQVGQALERGGSVERVPGGAEARLAVGEGKQARLCLEQGRWKVETLE